MSPPRVVERVHWCGVCGTMLLFSDKNVPPCPHCGEQQWRNELGALPALLLDYSGEATAVTAVRRIRELEERVAHYRKLAVVSRARALAAEAAIDRPWWQRLFLHRPSCYIAVDAIESVTGLSPAGQDAMLATRPISLS